MKVLYVLSTLKNSGPVNQLFNVIKNLPSSVTPIIFTLSDEPEDTRSSDFENIGCTISSLSLSRVSGIFLAKTKVQNYIELSKPDIIHSQGIRADDIVSKCKHYNAKWVSTAHNYPYEDYRMKFSMLKSFLMINNHIKSLRKCRHLVSCSYSIRDQLAKHSINAVAIQNGVSFRANDSFKTSDDIFDNLQRPVFITVGSLIQRKNNRFLIKEFNKYVSKGNKGTLLIVGDGPEKNELKINATERVIFTGQVNEPNYYLSMSDFFVSASLSEGLPNTVLEALSEGLPCSLSYIPSHVEINSVLSKSVYLYNFDKYAPLSVSFFESVVSQEFESGINLINKSKEYFSAESMSEKYYDFYQA